MLFNEVIYFATTNTTQNDMGDTIDNPILKQVFADKQSVRQSEFYQASANGLKPELMFVIRACEYNDETLLQYNSKNYNIIRTNPKGELLEIVCSGLVGDR